MSGRRPSTFESPLAWSRRSRLLRGVSQRNRRADRAQRARERGRPSGLAGAATSPQALIQKRAVSHPASPPTTKAPLRPARGTSTSRSSTARAHQDVQRFLAMSPPLALSRRLPWPRARPAGLRRPGEHGAECRQCVVPWRHRKRAGPDSTASKPTQPSATGSRRSEGCATRLKACSSYSPRA